MKNTAMREGAATASRPLALIAAGGEGKRLGSIGPKALVLCAGRPLLAWCLDAFARSQVFGAGAGLVVVAAQASQIDAFEDACAPARGAGLEVIVVPGGPSRSHSVAAALREGLGRAEATELVYVHDAARIEVTSELIDRLAGAFSELPGDVAGLIAAKRVTDTIKLASADGEVVQTPPRDRLWSVQTPQVFRAAALREALGIDTDVSDAVLESATDDASLVENLGLKVRVFETTSPNEKITTHEDLMAAETRLRAASV